MEHSRPLCRRLVVILAASLGLFLFRPGICPAAMCIEGALVFETGRDTIKMRQPSDIAVTSDRLFVLDDLNGRIAAFSLDGSFLSTIPVPGKGAVSYLGFDVGGDDNLYLASSAKGEIVVIDTSGKVLRSFSSAEKKEGSEPVGIDVSRGVCHIVDNGSHGVRILDLEGVLQEEWGGLGDGTGNFRYPFRIARDSVGRIMVTDSLNSRIQIFTPRGEALIVFGEFGVTEGTLYRPAGIAPWGENLLVVSDNYLGSIQFFDVKGRYQGVLCGDDGQPLIMDNPVSVAAAGSRLFVLEMGAGRVKAFTVQTR